MYTFTKRSQLSTNPTARKLLRLMDEKKTNLCVSADVTTKQAFLELVDQIGPKICLLKTHIDIIKDFDQDLLTKMQELATKHQFMIFEDRKFADIGNTVKYQYENKIVDFADIINAHMLPGPGIIEGLKTVGMPKGRGLLLLAQMSSKDNLLTDEYTKKTVEYSKMNADFVIGFIAQSKLENDPRFLYLTPGVKKEASSDNLGQQYNTPESMIQKGTDIIIVGRGIYEAENPKEEAAYYRKLAWDAYIKRLALCKLEV